MIVKIYEPEGKEKVIRLKLKEVFFGVAIVAVDDAGNELEGGNILWIDADGILRLYNNINKDIGLRLDIDRRIKIEGDYVSGSDSAKRFQIRGYNGS